MDALSPSTTKGDLLVDNGTNVIRLAVGTDAQVLTAHSAQAAGVKWAAAAGSLTVQREDTKVDTAVTTLVFAAEFQVTSSPAGEANVSCAAAKLYAWSTLR